jgi:hypothetical protein
MSIGKQFLFMYLHLVYHKQHNTTRSRRKVNYYASIMNEQQYAALTNKILPSPVYFFLKNDWITFLLSVPAFNVSDLVSMSVQQGSQM